jgi:hypothetical protein
LRHTMRLHRTRNWPTLFVRIDQTWPSKRKHVYD